MRQNFDLNTKFQEIPKADADILSAGLRGNPFVFASADDNPYGRYSPQRTGEILAAVIGTQRRRGLWLTLRSDLHENDRGFGDIDELEA